MIRRDHSKQESAYLSYQFVGVPLLAIIAHFQVFKDIKGVS